MKGFWFACMWIFPCVHFFAIPCLGQRSGGGTAPSIRVVAVCFQAEFSNIGGMGAPMGAEESGGDILSSRVAEQQARSRNSERQKRLESDTNKLVDLVNDLKQQIQEDKKLSPCRLEQARRGDRETGPKRERPDEGLKPASMAAAGCKHSLTCGYGSTSVPGVADDRNASVIMYGVQSGCAARNGAAAPLQAVQKRWCR